MSSSDTACLYSSYYGHSNSCSLQCVEQSPNLLYSYGIITQRHLFQRNSHPTSPIHREQSLNLPYSKGKIAKPPLFQGNKHPTFPIPREQATNLPYSKVTITQPTLFQRNRLTIGSKCCNPGGGKIKVEGSCLHYDLVPNDP